MGDSSSTDQQEQYELTDEGLDRLLKRVQALINKAESTEFPEEAESLRAKAEALMHRYRIDAAMLGGSSDTDGGGQVPEWRRFDICPMKSEFRGCYRVIFSSVLSHFDCRGVMEYDYEAEVLYADSVGMRGELRMAEALYVACTLAFSLKLEPVVREDLSDQENAYLLRSAGVEGWRIAAMLWPDVPPGDDGKPPKGLRVKARGLFKKEAEARGEDPSVLLGKGNSVANYREDFASGFVSEIHSRLAKMRRSRGEVSGGLVLAGQKEKVEEALYERYPSLRPRPSSGPSQDPRANCERCKAAKSGYCREHAWLKPRAGGRGRSFNTAAYDRGATAAQAVDLGPGSGERKMGQNGPKGELG